MTNNAVNWLTTCAWSSPYATFDGLAGVSAQLFVCLFMCPCNLVQACLNERPSEGLGEVLGGLRGVMEAEALQLNSETKALHDLKVWSALVAAAALGSTFSLTAVCHH